MYSINSSPLSLVTIHAEGTPVRTRETYQVQNYGRPALLRYTNTSAETAVQSHRGYEFYLNVTPCWVGMFQACFF